MSAELFQRYQELQRYVGWSADDAKRVRQAGVYVQDELPDVVDDFYEEIERHPEARRVIVGGQEQILRLKGTLIRWLEDLFSGNYDEDYVTRRWRVGYRHVEIGLDQVYTNAALSRIRRSLMQVLKRNWKKSQQELLHTRDSINTLLDLDLAIIESAYQHEYGERLQKQERLAARAQVAEAKARSEHMFRSLLEAAPCMIVILDPEQRIQYLSPFAEQMTGYARADVEGKIYGDVFLADARTREAVARDIEKVLSGVPTRGFENSIRCQDGAVRWMIWNAQDINYEGQPGVLAVGQDLTSFKQAQEKAFQAERLAAIGQMVTGLAHESGNALARSQACLEMLSMEVEENAEALDLIQRIQKAQDHLRQLYEEVRGYAAPLKLDRDTWDLSFVWRQTWNNLALTRKDRQATLEEIVHNVNLECSVDQFRLDQVFRNIFENALAACADPVQICIECSACQLGEHLGIRLAIRDNGPGLDAQQRAHLFEPFFTTKTKGTGLGMPIAKRIVEAHGGSIAVGEATAGAEIVIVLPRDHS